MLPAKLPKTPRLATKSKAKPRKAKATLTRRQRSAINRQNGKKGGPKTPEGKAKSCRNALKHGLRAEKLALPNEDHQEFARREAEWNAHYQPNGPGEAYLVTLAVRATIQLDRCARIQTAELSKQVRSALDRWDRDRHDLVQRQVLALNDNPRDAFLDLNRTARGCEWMVEDWTRLRVKLVTEGYWTAADVNWARALGANFEDPERIMVDPAYTRVTPEREEAIRKALAEIDEFLEEARSRAKALSEAIDGPERAEAPERALVIADLKLAGAVQRCQNAATSCYFRAFGALEKARKERGDEADDDPAPDEPKPHAESMPNPDQDATSDDPPPRPRRRRPAPGRTRRPRPARNRPRRRSSPTCSKRPAPSWWNEKAPNATSGDA